MKSTTSRLIVIGIVLVATLLGLWPTFRYYQLQGERSSITDSVALVRWDSLNGDAYRSAQAGRIKLGLDLQGGIYIAMEVDAPTLLLETAQRDAVDEPFQNAIRATADEARLSDDPVIDIFSRNFEKIVRPTGKTLLDYYDLGSLGNDPSDEAILTQLSKNIDAAVDQAVEVVRQRIDKYGVSEPTIQKQGGRRIIVELPGADNEDEVRSLLQTTARLEFKAVRDGAEVIEVFKKIDGVLAGKVSTDSATAKPAPKPGDTTATADSAGTKADTGTSVASNDTNRTTPTDTGAAKPIASADSGARDTTGGAKPSDTIAGKTDTTTKDTNDPYAGLSDEERVKRYRADHPFTTLFNTSYRADNSANQPQDATTIYAMAQFPAGIYEFFTNKETSNKIQALLNRRDVKSVMPEDMIIAFSVPRGAENAQETDPEKIPVSMYVLKRDPELTGEVVTNAVTDFDHLSNRPVVVMEMNSDGAEQWASITEAYIQKRVAIVLDSMVYSAPVIQNKITGGSSQITGSSDVKEAELLAVVLKAGALKAPVKIIEERIVGPSLGEDSISKGVWSTVAATILVFLFMMVYYRTAGTVANLGLLFNVLITLAVLASFDATLTLPGIGGLVLTIGMAVDGNILIYERIREEMAAGRNLRSAVELGYQKAWSAVIDTHITTLISGAILYIFGSGPVQGFAVTLIIGLTATLFTAVFVTHTIFRLMIDRGASDINFGQPKEEARRVAVATR